MSTLSEERISAYVKTMSDSEADYLVRQLPSQLMRNELDRRDRLKTSKLEIINHIINSEEFI